MGYRSVFVVILCCCLAAVSGCRKEATVDEGRVGRAARSPGNASPKFPTEAAINSLNTRHVTLEAEADAISTESNETLGFDGNRSQTGTSDITKSDRQVASIWQGYEQKYRDLLRQTAVIYGAESRSLLTAMAAVNLSLNTSPNAIVALVHARDVTKTANECKLKTKPYTRGERHRLCTGEKFRGLSSVAFCTGFLASKNQVVTAGHCVPSQGDLNQTYLVFGFIANDAGVVKVQYAPEDAILGGTLQARRDDATGDWAIVQIPDQTRPPIVLASTPARAGTKVYTMGHPQGLPLVHSGDAEIRPWSDPSPFFRANLDAFGGNSGSPVFDASSGEVIGVISEGETDFRTKIMDGMMCDSPFLCPKSGCQGEKCTRVTVFASRINK